MEERNKIAGAAEKIALMATAALERELDPAPGEKRDTKTARELSGIIRDMVALSRELSGEKSRSVTVRFEGDTEDAAK